MTLSISRPQVSPVKATLLITGALPSIAGAAVSPILPTLRDAFAFDPNADLLVRLVFTLPGLVIALFAPISGIAIDRLGRKGLLIGAIILFALAGGSAALAQTLTQILMGRVLLGIAVALIATATTTLVGDYYSGQERAQMTGMQAAFLGFGGFLTMLISGLLATYDWRFSFLFYLVFLVLAPICFSILQEPQKSTDTAHDAPDQRSLIDGVSHWFVSAIIIVTFLGMMFFFTIPIQVPFVLAQFANSSPGQAGLAVGICIMCAGLAAMYFPTLKARFSYPIIIAIISGLMGAGFAMVGLAQTSLHVMLVMPLCGFGMGLIAPAVTLALLNVTTISGRGRIMGAITFATFLGQFFSPIAAHPILSVAGLNGLFLFASSLLALLFVGACGVMAFGRFHRISAS